MKLFKKIQLIKTELNKMDIKKSGTGSNGKRTYDYYELYDFMPFIIDLCSKHNIFCHLDFKYDIDTPVSVLTIYNLDDAAEKISHTFRIRNINMPGANDVQNDGAITTYAKRYLYMIAFDILEKDLSEQHTGQYKSNIDNTKQHNNQYNDKKYTGKGNNYNQQLNNKPVNTKDELAEEKKMLVDALELISKIADDEDKKMYQAVYKHPTRDGILRLIETWKTKYPKEFKTNLNVDKPEDYPYPDDDNIDF